MAAGWYTQKKITDAADCRQIKDYATSYQGTVNAYNAAINALANVASDITSERLTVMRGERTAASKELASMTKLLLDQIIAMGIKYKVTVHDGTRLKVLDDKTYAIGYNRLA